MPNNFGSYVSLQKSPPRPQTSKNPSFLTPNSPIFDPRNRLTQHFEVSIHISYAQTTQNTSNMHPKHIWLICPLLKSPTRPPNVEKRPKSSLWMRPVGVSIRRDDIAPKRLRIMTCPESGFVRGVHFPPGNTIFRPATPNAASHQLQTQKLQKKSGSCEKPVKK